MGNRFKVTGTVQMAASKRSLAIEMVNLWGKHYVSIKDVQDVIAGRKKTATIFVPHEPRYKVSYYVREKK